MILCVQRFNFVPLWKRKRSDQCLYFTQFTDGQTQVTKNIKFQKTSQEEKQSKCYNIYLYYISSTYLIGLK